MTILQTNDFHGLLSEPMARQIRALKDAEDALYFDCGDCIKTGNLGIPLRREVAWDRLTLAGCDGSVLGNRETHVLTSAFEAKVNGASQPIFCANLRSKAGQPSFVSPSKIIEKDELRIGIFGVMVAMVTERMATKKASAYIWDDPHEVAKQEVAALRPQCDVLIALTHIGHRQDILLAEKCPEIDVILGGHSHTVLQKPDLIGKTQIFQAGSHGRFVGRYEFSGTKLRESQLIALA
ncbi:MAG: hypothetical protein ABL949_16450 [Fimbriimonadaceae bacterium]